MHLACFADCAKKAVAFGTAFRPSPSRPGTPRLRNGADTPFPTAQAASRCRPRPCAYRRPPPEGKTLLVLGVLAAGSGCTPLDTSVPNGFDLSGEWLLVERLSDAAPDVTAIRRREDRDVVRGRQANASASAAFVVTDFPVLAAHRMNIEQNVDSMGIRYDENTYRDISWGVRERDFWTVQAGWEEEVLVIRSNRGGVKGVERLVLEDAGSLLRVSTTIKTEGEDVRVTRVYRRR